LKMRTVTTKGIQITAVFVISLVLAVLPAQATTHVINFGGALGLHYSPDQLDVAVGDTVEWVGSFTTHPLSSTSVPEGAATFHVTSGTTFSYPVLVAGTYNYQCDVHFSLGMVGTFAATVAGIEQADNNLQPSGFELAQNYPNPFNSRTIIQFTLPVAQHVKLKIYSVTGAEIATLLDESVPAGDYSIPFDAGNLASGVYFYRLFTEKFMGTKRFTLVK
jgi:plastocyanin